MRPNARHYLPAAAVDEESRAIAGRVLAVLKRGVRGMCYVLGLIA
jgi:hypothetical protein